MMVAEDEAPLLFQRERGRHSFRRVEGIENFIDLTLEEDRKASFLRIAIQLFEVRVLQTHQLGKDAARRGHKRAEIAVAYRDVGIALVRWIFSRIANSRPSR